VKNGAGDTWHNSCSVAAILKIVLLADWVRQFLRRSDWFSVVFFMSMMFTLALTET